MRRITVILGIVFGIIVLSLGAIWVLANPNRHRELIQTQLEAQLGRKVTLGEMTLGFLPLRFKVENPVIAEDPSIAAAQPFVRAEELDVRIELLPLLRGNLNVNSIELRRPSVELVRTRQGVWNFSMLGPKTTVSSTPPKSGSAREFSLSRLAIHDGQIGVTDLQQARPRTGYDHIDLTLLDYTAGKPFSFDLAAHIQGEGAQEVRLKGEGGPVSSTNPANTPFHGTLKVNQVGIDGLLKFLDTKAVTEAKGVLSGESDIASQSGNITTSGKVKLEKAQFNKLDIGYPIQFDYDLAAGIEDGLVSINNATVQLGKTPLSVSGSLNTSATPVRMDLKIKAGEVAIDEIARLASAFGVAFAPGATVTGRVSADLQARGAITKPVLTGTIAGRDLQVSGQGVPQPVQVKAINLALSPTAIQSNEFNATSGTTTVIAKFAMLQYASNAPSVDLGLRTPGATLPEIQSIAKAYGVTGLDQLAGAGTLNFDLHANGPMQSLSSGSAMKTLNGVINLDFSPLKILGFDTVHELGTIAGFKSNPAAQSATEIVKVVGRIFVKDGIAQTDDLKAQLAIGNLSAAGTADLTAETLNLKLAAIFSKAFSDKAGTLAGSLMNAAFANNAGELILPAIVTGTFKQPRFAPDLKAVVQLQKQKLISTADDPAGALRNVLDALKGKSENNSPEQPAGEKPSTIKGLLDVFGRKKTPEK